MAPGRGLVKKRKRFRLFRVKPTAFGRTGRGRGRLYFGLAALLAGLGLIAAGWFKDIF